MTTTEDLIKQLTAERDRARDIAMLLEEENAQLRRTRASLLDAIADRDLQR